MTERKTTSTGTGAGVQKPTTCGDARVDRDYRQFEAMVAERIASLTGPVFTTDVDPDVLWIAYVNGFPEFHRQHYNCHCCRRFVQTYGGLVQLTEDGYQFPAVWPDASSVPTFFKKSLLALGVMLQRAKVNGVFIWSTGPTWGNAQTGVWTHLHGRPNQFPRCQPLEDVHQAMARLKEDHGVLGRSIAEHGPEAAAEALRVLNHGDALTRPEKVLGVAQWFDKLHRKLAATKNSQYRRNLLWLATATAPPGFCHVKNTMLGTLLDDIKAGLPFDQVARRWQEKMHPLQYQRPQADPTLGAIKQAERVFEELKLAPALERRWATMADVLTITWRPTTVETKAQPAGGLFSHLRTKQDRPRVGGLILPAQVMTWERFKNEVLTQALEMEVRVPTRGPFYGLFTAVHVDAPPLLQWDGLTELGTDPTTGQTGNIPLPRNPVGQYFYYDGSVAGDWNLATGDWVKVKAVFPAPAHWQHPEKFAHFPEAALFAMEGCVDKTESQFGRVRPGLGLFPETLRNELRPVRSVIEAHSNSRGPVGRDAPDQANGIALFKENRSNWPPLHVRVTTATGQATYDIDRWN